MEDERKIANSLKKGLEQELFAVDAVYDGLEGYDLAATEDYDLIILDLLLPDMDGLEICKKLRSEDKIQTPILILTAKGQLGDKIEGFKSGADDYLVKPFAFEELLARVKALLRRPKSGISQILKYKDLALDTENFSVKRGDTPIDLSRKEFALLEFLLRHPETVLTKEKIIAHVWDYEADILPNTVEVFIGTLRDKVDRAFKSKPNLIQTVRGFGYRLQAAG